MDTTIITLIEIIKGSFSVRILGNKLNVKNDKIRLINICIDNKSRVAIVQRFFFLSFFFLFDLFPRISLILRFKIHRFVRNSRDFGISVLFIFVGGWDVIRIDQGKDIGNTINREYYLSLISRLWGCRVFLSGIHHGWNGSSQMQRSIFHRARARAPELKKEDTEG